MEKTDAVKNLRIEVNLNKLEIKHDLLIKICNKNVYCTYMYFVLNIYTI